MTLEAVRDLAIVVLAIESIVIGVLLLVTLGQIRKLVSLLRDEIAPMLKAANDTARTMRGTANVMSESVVKPLVQVSSYTSGTVQALRTLVGIRRKLDRDRATAEPTSERPQKEV
jgi:hypothetical protein